MHFSDKNKPQSTKKLTKTNFQKIRLKLRIIQKIPENLASKKKYSNNAGIQQQGSKQ